MSCFIDVTILVVQGYDIVVPGRGVCAMTQIQFVMCPRSFLPPQAETELPSPFETVECQ